MVHLVRWMVAALACLLISAPPLYSQEVRASVTGTVSDSSGSAIAGATVLITNVATNTSVTSKTTEAGTYVVPFLAPGTYTLTVEQGGFKKFVRANIVLQSLDKARVDVTLEIGNLTESVTVSDSVSTLQTETASRGQTISNELIANLPTQGRNPFQLAWSAPGVVKTGSWRYLRSFDIGGTSGFSINGGRNQENEVLLDGISNVRSSRTVIAVPTMEAVQEFRVLTNTYDAQYGRTGGGIVTIVTKSGTNNLHGSLFEYFQNDKLNANQAELNAGGIVRPPNHINTYGFQVAGPVYVPKLFNGRNRLFWLLSYEAMKQRSSDPAVATVPLTEWRTGDFSSLLNAQGQPVLIYDPLTTQPDGSRTPFPGNRIPSSRLDNVALQALQYYPAPRTNGTGPAHLNNYPFPSRWIGDLAQWSGRTDLNINSKNTVYFRYGQGPYSEYRGLVFVSNPTENNPAEPTGNAPLRRNGRTWSSNWTSILTPNMTFDLRAGLNRWEETSGNSFGADFDPRTLGFNSALVSQFSRLQFPNLRLGQYQSLGSDRLLNFAANDVYSLQPTLNWVTGRHTFKFGMDFRRYHDNSQNPGLGSGQYTFNKDWTQANANVGSAVAGNELATFLLGYPSQALVDRNIDVAWKHYYYVGFFQDDWKVSNRLTLNVGLRWDYESPATERFDRAVRGLDLAAPSPIAPQVQGRSLTGQVLFANVNGQPRGSFTPDKNNIAPRVGIAYRLADRWVLRGGYGLYYLGQDATATNQGFSQRTNAVVTTDNLRPAVQLSNSFALQPNGQLLSPIGSSQGAASFLGQDLTVNWLNRPLPYSHQYSFDIQHEFAGGILAEVGYVGNQTRRLSLPNPNSEINANYIPASELGRRTAAGTIDTAYYNAPIANPLAGLIPLNSQLNGSTIPRQNLLFAYPQFRSVIVNNIPVGRQRYDALQTKVSKRFSQGLTLLASYTFSKTLEQVNLLNVQDLNLTDPTQIRLEKRPADQIDIPHKFNTTGIYELPFGRNKPLASNASRALDAFIGGWELNWNLTLSSGWAVNYPNALQAVPGSAEIDNPGVNQLFNASLWTDPNTGRRVSALENFTLRTFPTRFGNVRVPGYRNLDASVSKYFPITETVRLQFRFEAVNALNHPWFANVQPASVDVTNAQFGRLNPSQSNLPRFLKLGLNLQF